MPNWTPERIATVLQQEITDDQLVSIVLQADAQGTNAVRVTVDKSCLHYLCREIQRLRTALAEARRRLEAEDASQ